MLKKYPQFSFAFAIIFLAELLAITHHLKELRMVTKPLITISLMLFLYFSIKKKSRVARRVQLALLFSLFGDVLLTFVSLKVDTFTFGLLAFLIAQLFYISAFYLDLTKKTVIEHRFTLPIYFVFGFVWLFFFVYLSSYLGLMFIPVLVYSLTIVIMAVMASLRYGKTNYRSFLWTCWGAVFFLLSDGILAYNRFVEQFDAADILVMSTYMLAQYLIVMGIVERKFVIRT